MNVRLSNFYYIFFAAILLLLLLSTISYFQIKAMISSSELVDHTNLVRMKIEEVLSVAKDAETAQRGFILTKDTGFLQPFIGAEEQENSILKDLDSLVKDNPQQSENLRDYRHLLASGLVNLNVAREYRFAPDFDPDSLHVLLLKGKFAMDAARAQATQMIRAEQILLTERMKNNNRNIYLTPLLSLILSLAFLAIAIISFFIIRRKYTEEVAMQSQLQHINRELDERNKELEYSNKELASFNHIASHDLQEPLRKLQLFSNRILEEDSTNISEKSKHYFNRIAAASMRMQELIKALLEYSRLTTNDVHLRETNLRDIVEDVKKNLYDVIEEKHAVIETESLPTVEAAPEQIGQLFSNLIDNSIKYSKKDVPPHIKISAKLVKNVHLGRDGQSQDFWKISFSDNGIGFEPKYGEKIFELFNRLHEKTEYSGTGIGLAICKKVAENHHGMIRATGKPGVGATFEFFIPNQI